MVRAPGRISMVCWRRAVRVNLLPAGAVFDSAAGHRCGGDDGQVSSGQVASVGCGRPESSAQAGGAATRLLDKVNFRVNLNLEVK
jgi:hypothetical protein